MKICIAIVLVMAVFMGAPAFGLADSTVPVAYWKLMDEERYIYRSDLERFDWREIRKIRRENTTAGQEAKHLTLNTVSAMFDSGADPLLDKRYLERAQFLVRDPNGNISPLAPASKKQNHISLPADINLIGRYLLGARIPLGQHDVDGDGNTETVILCAKHMIRHYKNGGNMGSTSVVFFDDGEKMPLEIGPAIDTAKNKFGGNMHLPHKTYDMMVKYNGRPLPGATVTVTTEGSQWKKTIKTDNTGKIEIMPTDDRFFSREWQNYLYTATHHNEEAHTYYVATLPTTVYKNRPEWRSKAMGFTLWAIVGTGISLLMVAGLTLRQKRRDRQALIVFDNRKIQKDLS
jgi:hypothetical protein